MVNFTEVTKEMPFSLILNPLWPSIAFINALKTTVPPWLPYTTFSIPLNLKFLRSHLKSLIYRRHASAPLKTDWPVGHIVMDDRTIRLSGRKIYCLFH